MEKNIIICIICTLFTGCATMYAPGSDNITIKTNPDGADIYYGANLLGQSPIVYTFDRETFQRQSLVIRKQGYKTKEVLLGTTLEKKALLNFGFFITTSGATSWAVDAATGNMIKYFPDSYLIDLEKDDNSSVQKNHSRIHRFRFVVMNQAHLMKDIAAGDGEYLRAYFENRFPNTTSNTYQMFQACIISKALLLLSTDDPVEFFNNLEVVA